MICDKCGYEYEIGQKGEYVNMYGTRCHKCSHLIKPEQEAKFIRDAKEKKQALVNEYLPILKAKIDMRETMSRKIEETKNAD